MSMWDITDRGFLGTNDPLRAVTSTSQYYVPLMARLETIPVMLPHWIEGRKVREELVYALREVAGLMDEPFFNNPPVSGEAGLERLMHLFSYMASAFVYARHENPATHIPSEISIPLARIATKLDRKPILSYASYCLTNWERMDPNGPIALDNLRLLTNFCTPEVGKYDEDWFILVHVEIEQAAAAGVSACAELLNTFQEGDTNHARDILTKLHRSLLWMNGTLDRMTEGCRPENYFRWVRPYIFSFNNMVYEGCFNNQRVTFRGETGAQSSIIPAFLAALEIKHKDSMLMQHLTEMRWYMPAPHRQFLQNLETRPANKSVRVLAQHDNGLKDIYNECVQEIIKFRTRHFEYAVNYIANKVENPSGTGGTPYIPWLKQLLEETEEYLIRSA